MYTISNSDVTLPLLSTHLLRLLFINLGDDALVFLAGLWLSPASGTHIQYAALRHACAFLEAHEATRFALDFQTVLPALLVALQSADEGVRIAAVRCLAVVARLAAANAADRVYAFDAVYGVEGSKKLQYLDLADFQKYAKALAEVRDSLTHDPEYVQAFHREHLAPTKGESKKISGWVLILLPVRVILTNSPALGTSGVCFAILYRMPMAALCSTSRLLF